MSGPDEEASAGSFTQAMMKQDKEDTEKRIAAMGPGQPCCGNCRWWAAYTNGLIVGACSVPLPPLSVGGGGGEVGAYMHRNPSPPHYYCVLHSKKEADT